MSQHAFSSTHNNDAKRVIEVAHLKDLRELMQLLWHLFEAVDRLPRGPEHTAAVQTVKRFERRLVVLVHASEKARAARLRAAGRAARQTNDLRTTTEIIEGST